MATPINAHWHYPQSARLHQYLEPARLTRAVDKVMDDYARNLREQEVKAVAIDNMESTRVIGRNIDVFA